MGSTVGRKPPTCATDAGRNLDLSSSKTNALLDFIIAVLRMQILLDSGIEKFLLYIVIITQQTYIFLCFLFRRVAEVRSWHIAVQNREQGNYHNKGL